jgi:GNAT superfamily N-acetyltransferase
MWKRESNHQKLKIDADDDIYIGKLQEFIDNPNNILLVLEDDEIVGYMGLQAFESPLGNQLIANEHYWYVLPEKRGFSALKFLHAAERWAKEKGCSHLIMNASNLASDLHDRTCRLYERFGMSKFETTYIKEV